MKPPTLLRPCAVAAFALLAACAAQAAPAYHLVDLGNNAEAWAINRDGVIAGALNANPGFYADSTWTTRRQPKGTARAYAIDSRGDAAGLTTPRRGQSTAEYWAKGTKAIAVPLSGYRDPQANAISPDGGIVLGTATDATFVSRCYTWTPGAPAVTPLPLAYCGASAINAKGQISGTATLKNIKGVFHGFVYENGQVTDIGALLHPSGQHDSTAQGINDKGHVTGSSTVADNHLRAIFWNGFHLLDLGTLGGTDSYGSAINDQDDIVGSSIDAQGNAQAFLYTGGRMLALAALIDNPDGWLDFGAPTAITDDGVIIGNGHYGSDTDLEFHAYMLVPIAQ